MTIADINRPEHAQRVEESSCRFLGTAAKVEGGLRQVQIEREDCLRDHHHLERDV